MSRRPLGRSRSSESVLDDDDDVDNDEYTSSSGRQRPQRRPQVLRSLSTAHMFLSKADNTGAAAHTAAATTTSTRSTTSTTTTSTASCSRQLLLTGGSRCWWYWCLSLQQRQRPQRQRRPPSFYTAPVLLLTVIQISVIITLLVVAGWTSLSVINRTYRQWSSSTSSSSLPHRPLLSQLLRDHLDHHQPLLGGGSILYRHGPRCQQAPYCQLHFPQQSDTSLTTLSSSLSVLSATAPHDAVLVTRTGHKGSHVPSQDRAVLLAPVWSIADENHHNNKDNKDNHGASIENSNSHSRLRHRHNNNNKKKNGGQQPRSWYLAGLFDGHGDQGHVIAEAAVRQLFFQLLPPLPITTTTAKPGQQHTFATAGGIPSTTISNNDQLAGASSSFSWWVDMVTAWDTSSPILQSIPDAGCTGLWAWVDGPHVYLASVGDSIGLVVRYYHHTNQVTILAQSIQHKPHHEQERARIEAAGGQVLLPEENSPGGGSGGVSSRVVIPNSRRGGEGEGGEEKGQDDDSTIELAMSRALGDMDGKKAGLLTAEPSIVSVDLSLSSSSPLHNDRNNPAIDYVVLLSDGVTDMIPLPRLAKLLGQAYATDDTNQSANALTRTTLALLNEADKKWLSETEGQYRDDMTLLTFRVRHSD